MTTLAGVAVALTWLLLAGGAWFSYQLLRQNGRLLGRIEALEREIRAGGTGRARPFGDRSLKDSRINRSGLRPGTAAPAFALPRVDGGQLSLEEYVGRRVLLVFSDPACGPCDALAPSLERLSRRAVGMHVIMVSRGDAEANRRKIAEHGLTFPVVLQRHWEISGAYGKFVTPVAYLIDERGAIAADAAVGVDPILKLLSRDAGASVRGAGDTGPGATAAVSQRQLTSEIVRH